MKPRSVVATKTRFKIRKESGVETDDSISTRQHTSSGWCSPRDDSQKDDEELSLLARSTNYIGFRAFFLKINKRHLQY